MREKMRASLVEKESGKFDLKQSKGGIADIEFIVQYGVLSQAEKFPALTTYTDNVRQLDGLAEAGFSFQGKCEKPESRLLRLSRLWS